MIFITAISLPFLTKEPIDLPPLVSVELIQISDKTNIPYAPKAKKIIEEVKKKEEEKLTSEQAPPKKVKKEKPDAVPLPDENIDKVKKIEEKKQNPEKLDEEIKQVSEFEKKELFDPKNIAALIDKSKEEFAETTKKTNKISQSQKKDLSRWMIRNLKIWDEKIINLIIKQINDSNSIFIDIGCNYGAYSIPISRIKNNLKVICFDPSRKSLDRLDENINLNNLKNIKYFKLGIGEKKGKVYFDDDINNYKNSGSFEINNKNFGYKIDIDSIDNLVRENKIQIKKNVYIKMDIEGYEFFALKGLVKTINNYNVTIFFEFSKKILENHLNFESEFVEFLNKNTLKIYNSNFVEQNLTDLILDLNNLKKDHDVLDNFILQKKDN